MAYPRSRVPLGGFPTRARLLSAPRSACAYDLTGRQDCSPRRLGPLLLPLRPVHQRSGYLRGSETVTLTPNSIGNKPLLLSTLNSIPFTATLAAPSAVDSTDNKQPYTDSYSFTVSQRMPWSSLFEVAYVGNRATICRTPPAPAATSTWFPSAHCFSQPNPGHGES